MTFWLNLSKLNHGKEKAGGYDLAGQMGKYAYLVKGSESVVLGLSIEPFKHLLRKT